MLLDSNPSGGSSDLLRGERLNSLSDLSVFSILNLKSTLTSSKNIVLDINIKL